MLVQIAQIVKQQGKQGCQPKVGFGGFIGALPIGGLYIY